MKAFLTLMPVDEALALIKGFAALPAEEIDLDKCEGRRLAEAFLAPHDLPGFPRSTMDGFAARARDLFGAGEGSPALLRHVGDCLMGCQPVVEIGPGDAAGIHTGGMLPKGADCVVMVEYSRPAGLEYLEITRPHAPGENMVGSSDDAGRGEELIARGRKLRPQEIGVLAAFGVQKIAVVRPARVAIISTGDEVVPLETRFLQPGQIRDVNAHSIAAMCRAEGAMPVLQGIVNDEPNSLKKTLAEVLPTADVIVVSGGSSAGMRDHTVEAFSSIADARILAQGVAISPGKPFILGRCGAKALIGLPGHVTSALICARVFLAPLLQRLQGKIEDEPMPVCQAVLTRSVASAQGRRDYIRVALHKNVDCYEATPITAPSALISGLARADGLVICPENSEGLAAGQKVSVQMLL